MNRCCPTLFFTFVLFSAGPLRADFGLGDSIRFDPISKGIQHATELKIYEGLPHQTFEAEARKREFETKKTTELHGEPFYERHLKPSADDIETLRRLLTPEASFDSYRGPKLCGGFHPDYCLVWKDGNATYELLICLHCHELKLFGPKTNLTLDVRDEAFAQLHAVLKKYRDQRPKQNAKEGVSK